MKFWYLKKTWNLDFCFFDQLITYVKFFWLNKCVRIPIIPIARHGAKVVKMYDDDCVFSNIWMHSKI